MKVLIVDDDYIVCKGLTETIPWQEIGVELIGYEMNGKAAYDRAKNEDIDLIISDIKMPVMDGIGLAKALQKDMPKIKIILLSAHEDFNYARDAIQFGVIDYILKPINIQKIKKITIRLKELQIQHENEENFAMSFNEQRFTEAIRNELRNGNKDFIETIFEDKICNSLKYNQFRSLCLKIVNVLFDFFIEIHMNEEIVQKNRDEILRELLCKNSQNEMKEFIELLYIDVLTAINTKRNQKNERLAEYIEKYIIDNYKDMNLSVTSLADKLKITSAHLSMIFKETKGINAGRFITKVRIEHAKEMLVDTNYSIQIIAGNVGYIDSKYFAKVFKKLEGLTPSDYRKLYYNIGGDNA